ncbi:MAG TPA: hypothetical protein VEG66_02350 [Thermoplasmata archaeon]|nr:hypothetical protein [Thermoplasmata archaeon]
MMRSPSMRNLALVGVTLALVAVGLGTFAPAVASPAPASQGPFVHPIGCPPHAVCQRAPSGIATGACPHLPAFALASGCCGRPIDPRCPHTETVGRAASAGTAL